MEKSSRVFDDLTGDEVEAKINEFYGALVNLLESKNGKTGKFKDILHFCL